MEAEDDTGALELKLACFRVTKPELETRESNSCDCFRTASLERSLTGRLVSEGGLKASSNARAFSIRHQEQRLWQALCPGLQLP